MKKRYILFLSYFLLLSTKVMALDFEHIFCPMNEHGGYLLHNDYGVYRLYYMEGNLRLEHQVYREIYIEDDQAKEVFYFYPSTTYSLEFFPSDEQGKINALLTENPFTRPFLKEEERGIQRQLSCTIGL